MELTLTTKPKRRWRTMSLRALMLLILGIAGWLAWETNRARAQRRAVQVIARSGGSVLYDDQGDKGKNGGKMGSDLVSSYLLGRVSE